MKFHRDSDIEADKTRTARAEGGMSKAQPWPPSPFWMCRWAKHHPRRTRAMVPQVCSPDSSQSITWERDVHAHPPTPLQTNWIRNSRTGAQELCSKSLRDACGMLKCEHHYPGVSKTNCDNTSAPLCLLVCEVRHADAEAFIARYRSTD